MKSLPQIQRELAAGQFEFSRHALHLQVSFAESDATKIITIYEPDSNEWIENRKRR